MTKIKPDVEDFKAASGKPGTEGDRFRLAQARKLIRLYAPELLDEPNVVPAEVEPVEPKAKVAKPS